MMMTLRPKNQNRVLGRSAGVPCEVASSLRSQCKYVNNVQIESYCKTTSSSFVLYFVSFSRDDVLTML